LPNQAVVELNLATQSCVYRDYSRGLRTQTWGDTVFSVRDLEMCLPTNDLGPGG